LSDASGACTNGFAGLDEKVKTIYSPLHLESCPVGQAPSSNEASTVNTGNVTRTLRPEPGLDAFVRADMDARWQPHGNCVDNQSLLSPTNPCGRNRQIVQLNPEETST
jgi:hypothetical protein